MMVDMNISPNMQGEEHLAHHSLLKLQFFFSMIFILFSILMIFLGRNTNVYLLVPILTTVALVSIFAQLYELRSLAVRSEFIYLHVLNVVLAR